MMVLANALPIIYLIHTILFGFTCSALWKLMLEKRKEAMEERRNCRSRTSKIKDTRGTWTTVQFEFE